MLKSITFINVTAALFLVLSAIGLGFIIKNLDPNRTANVVILYLDVIVLICSLTYLPGFYLRQTFGVREFAWKHVGISARQSLWFAILVWVSLMLLASGLFNWLNAGLLTLSLVFLESYFLFK